MSERLTHLDDAGRAQMVDVGDKPATKRVAEAEGWIRMSEAAFRAVAERSLGKGDVLAASERQPAIAQLELAAPGTNFNATPFMQ